MRQHPENEYRATQREQLYITKLHRGNLVTQISPTPIIVNPHHQVCTPLSIERSVHRHILQTVDQHKRRRTDSRNRLTL